MPKSPQRREAVSMSMGRLLIALVVIAVILASLGGRGFHSGG
jgi:hypothetical protein